MRINIAETLRNPARTLDGLVAEGMAHTMASFAFAELSKEEFAYVEAENRAAAIRYREEFRVVLRDQFRAAGLRVADDWGLDRHRHLHVVTPEPRVGSGPAKKIKAGHELRSRRDPGQPEGDFDG